MGPRAFWTFSRGFVYDLRGIDAGKETPGVEAGEKLAEVQSQVVTKSKSRKVVLHTYNWCPLILSLERDLDFSVSLDCDLFTGSR
jgi:hypothetical protein